jgi:hypothetical protein
MQLVPKLLRRLSLSQPKDIIVNNPPPWCPLTSSTWDIKIIVQKSFWHEQRREDQVPHVVEADHEHRE